MRKLATLAHGAGVGKGGGVIVSTGGRTHRNLSTAGVFYVRAATVPQSTPAFLFPEEENPA